MAWIKRNLYFLLGSLVALALMIVGGVLLFKQISDENAFADDIKSKYAELKRLSDQKPHPGHGQIDNIKAAKEQAAALRASASKLSPYFQRITPIPDTALGKVSNEDFAGQLRNTVAHLQRSAEQQSVLLPHDYYFTFEAQKSLMIFDPASLDKLAVHLGEIKALCTILFDAKINSLESIRREIASTNDTYAADYLTDQKTVSTPLADQTPYRVNFHCFSAELATVLGKLAGSPNGFIVKGINVEPAAPTTAAEGMSAQPMQNYYPNQTTVPGYVNPDGTRRGSGGPMAGGGLQPVTAAPRNTGPTVFLNEHPLKVTLLVEVVKPKQKK